MQSWRFCMLLGAQRKFSQLKGRGFILGLLYPLGIVACSREHAPFEIVISSWCLVEAKWKNLKNETETECSMFKVVFDEYLLTLYQCYWLLVNKIFLLIGSLWFGFSLPGHQNFYISPLREPEFKSPMSPTCMTPRTRHLYSFGEGPLVSDMACQSMTWRVFVSVVSAPTFV